MVIANTVSLGLENLGDQELVDKRTEANLWFTYIFIVELLLKVYVLGAKEYGRDKMNLFDAVIVATSVMELVSNMQSSNETTEDGAAPSSGPAYMSVFRTAKLFRVLKTLKTLRVLRTIKLLRALDYLQVIIDVVQRTYK
jgi:hypothetical protein